MPSFTHCKNIPPSTNYLIIEEIKIYTPRMTKKIICLLDSTHLDSLVIVHNPLFMVMAVSKAMVVLTIVANLKGK